MNEKKLQRLFAAARNETAPAPPADFAADVLRAVRRAPPIAAADADSLFAQLNFLFPRVALAAAAVIVLCVAADFGLTAAGLPEVGDGAAQAAQFLFNAEDL
jgi:anti-sigma-K factor RskA